MRADQQINDIKPDPPIRFLAGLAKNLQSEFGQNMSGVAVVMPNTRSGFYLKNEIKALFVEKNVVLPTLFSMDEWVKYLVQKPFVSELEARILLFESFRKVKNSEEQLDTFFPLGQVLFQDFEEIVRNKKPLYLVYRELSKWEETGANFADFLDEEQIQILERFWAQFDANELSQAKKRFISLWRSLPFVFENFTQNLNANGRITSGMAYAEAADFLPESPLIQNFEAIWFAGFGHISLSEKRMMERLCEMKKGKCFWDIKEWFFNQKHLEYSRLFARISKSETLQNSILRSLDLQAKEFSQPEINIIYSIGLAGMATAIKELTSGKGAETVVYVTEPGLIEALLHVGYQGNFPYNITLGFPISNTTPFHWISKVFSILEKEESIRFFHWQEVFKHAFFLSLFPDEQPVMPLWMQQKSKGPLDWFALFTSWWQSLDFESLENPEWKFASLQLLEILSELKSLVESFPESNWTYQAFFQCFTGIANQKNLAIEGSSEKGIQVMGLYEGRVLDFEEVIIAPAEDGNFPSKSRKNTFLNEGIRRAFGLPLISHEADDEVYQFYRLFHRSKKITLLLSQGQETKPSRLVQQLRYSLDFKANTITQSSEGQRPLAKPILIDKNDWFFERLNQFLLESEAGKYLSPSSLHDLLSCELRFYFSKIEKLETEETVLDIEMDPRDFGNWVHGCVQALYEKVSHPGKWLEVIDYQTMKSLWPTVSIEVWNKLNQKMTDRKLEDFLIEMEVGKIMAFRFLDKMAEEEPHKWIENELSLPNLGLEVESKVWNLSGRADLVFETQNSYWLVDLKTGSFLKEGDYKITPKNIDKLDSKILKNKELCQMLLYAFIGNKKKIGKNKPVDALLFHMANPNGNLINPISNEMDKDLIFNSLEMALGKKIAAFANPDLEIGQTEDISKCTYCDFAGICQR